MVQGGHAASMGSVQVAPRFGLAVPNQMSEEQGVQRNDNRTRGEKRMSRCCSEKVSVGLSEEKNFGIHHPLI
jgi:hypothetical protein